MEADQHADTVRPSALYKGCLYCPRRQAHYTPNLEWGVPWPKDRNDTTAHVSWMVKPRNKGTDCPFCGAQFDGTLRASESDGGLADA